MEVFHGPDFATGGVVVDSAAAIMRSLSQTGSGAFRRARAVYRAEAQADGSWDDAGIERLGSGQWQLVISRNPVSGAQGQADRADRAG